MTQIRQGAVVVTGASTGIGAACALRLDHLGFQVFAGVRRKEDAQALQAKASPQLMPIFLDVTDLDSITAAMHKVAITVGNSGLIGLVNNAGIAVGAPLEFIPITEFRKQLEVNVTGQLAVTQAFLPLLRLAKGRIVNMGSITGRSATPFLGAYSASKFALEALTDALRLELRPWGIWVAILNLVRYQPRFGKNL
jgi:NAD(P)-dependent dehydrogenase (short-subunit alcohol dehydrogenase family)